MTKKASSPNRRPTNDMSGGTLLDHEFLLGGIVGVGRELVISAAQEPEKTEYLGCALLTLLDQLDGHLQKL